MASLEVTDADKLKTVITRTANLGQVASAQEDTYLYTGKTLAHQCDVLVQVKMGDEKATITVNCEKIVIGSMLIKDIKLALSSS